MRRVAGRDLILATHGFNVDQRRGVESLSLWATACPLPSNSLFVGILWPGDSRIPVLVDYVYEGVEAIASGKLLAAYLNAHAGQAASLSFASHSLGARTVLETVAGLSLPVRRMTLMAGAIENDCLAREYSGAARKAGQIVVVASRSDDVLKWLFPAGNLIGEIVMHGHPYDRTALGRNGAEMPFPQGVSVDPWQIPVDWDYGHLDYLPKDAIGSSEALPVPKPGPDDGPPVDPQNSTTDWKPAWSAGVLATKAK